MHINHTVRCCFFLFSKCLIPTCLFTGCRYDTNLCRTRIKNWLPVCVLSYILAWRPGQFHSVAVGFRLLHSLVCCWLALWRSIQCSDTRPWAVGWKQRRHRILPSWTVQVVYMILILGLKMNETKSEEYFWYTGANRIPKCTFLEKLGRVKVAGMASRRCTLLMATDRNCTGVMREYS